jgi:predicted ribosome quality control (RQC) complex YloA/Tae2 family protein
MKTEISSLELYYLIGEFKVLEGSKIDRIYHSKNNSKELTIGCHVTGQGKKIFRTIIPGIIFLDESKDSTDTPTGFGMMLRKYLEGGRLKSITQKDFERVITLTLETKKDSELSTYFLVIELFSKGNIIFCDDKFKILNILEEQSWKDRILKRNETYLYPKSKINTLTISEDEFKEKILSSNKESLVKTLAITFNLGGTYSEELCYMSGIEKNSDVKKLTDKDYNNMYKNLILLLHKELSPNSCDDNIFPFKLESVKYTNINEYDTFSKAIRENYELIKHDNSKKDSGKNLEKIQNIIDEQTKLLEECEEGYTENQAKGELIYAKYQEIDNIMKAVKEARKKYSWNAIKQKLNDNPEFKKIIKDIDEKNNSIIIEIEK